MSRPLTLTIPRKGRIRTQTEEFFRSRGLTIEANKDMPFLATLKEIDGINVRYRNAEEVAEAYWGGDLDAGITGWDLLLEKSGENSPEVVRDFQGLGYCQASLRWLVPKKAKVTDAEEMHTVGTVSLSRIRVATKYPNLVRSWLVGDAVRDMRFVIFTNPIEGAWERGESDVVADLVCTGETASKHGLRQLKGNAILESEAVLCWLPDLDPPKQAALDLLKERLGLDGGHAESRYRQQSG